MRQPDPFPPPWAAAWGDDRHGLWADLGVAGVVQRLRWIEPGEFMMGDEHAPESQTRRSCEGFWLADSACTQALWLAVMGGENPARFQQGDQALQHPVEQVSWDDTQHFLARLAAHTPGGRPELPDEREWEYACRAGTTGPFSFGDDITPELVNYDGNHPYRGTRKGLYRETTVPVRSLPRNPWGLYEMHGNVWEWCSDAVVEGEVANGAEAELPRRALRGGSWNRSAKRARSADRDAFGPTGRGGSIGFRFALRSTSPRPHGTTSPEPGFRVAGRHRAR